MKPITRSILSVALGATLALGANLPNYKTLCEELGEIPGWSLTKCEGMKMVNPMMGEVVTAAKTYTKGDSSLEVTVVSGMQAMMMWGPYAAGTTIENDEALVKLETIDGFQVGISYDKKERSGGIVVRLADNAVLGGNFQNMDWKEALDLMKKIDWKRLASLFR
ncbi:hypothetical protein [Hydrogenimonas cancrithermarum]|uniref:Uncharacterized protein n=1 Tax=Hydrogenimonas cancrithermarum TaxID=2993563 RepID=A0ABN6WV68_9BACT|nr:hypothetical protein [Hydrogenimonas cancrithermarum]BDY12843.1 hypothetical protein HCR_11550 [Hydrogenimonas cancrithermarum]BDY12960.1 hypothetical protein HCR_12720 [Hydrogenimonas cancrithermarum]